MEGTAAAVQPTATPWKVYYAGEIYAGKEFIAEVNAIDRPVAVRDANAAYLVRAANCHQELVELLTQAHEEIRLAHTKDRAVYDPTILTRIEVTLTKAAQ